MKRLLILLAAMLLLCSSAVADSLPLGVPAPYPPVASAYSEDGLHYDDGTISVSIETDMVGITKVYYVTVKLTDPSQLRTALADPFDSSVVRVVPSMGAENNAVLAVNGDFYGYHSAGIVIRGGRVLRERPEAIRDTLVIDENGDMSFFILPEGLTRRDKITQLWADFQAEHPGIREAFCFGPALIIDGKAAEFQYRKKISCGAPTPAQRCAICQLGPLEYMFFCCEGPEQNKKAGLNIFEVTDLLLAKGVQQAYNLDGGNSVTIYFNGGRVNAPESKLRPVSDCIYFATLAGSEE